MSRMWNLNDMIAVSGSIAVRRSKRGRGPPVFMATGTFPYAETELL